MDEEKINKRFEEIEKRLDALEREEDSVVQKGGSKKKSIKEFFIENNLSKAYQKTLVICYYLENYEGMKSFKVKDIEEGYKLSKEKTPNNVNYHIVQNIQKGYLMETKEDEGKLKAWTLTNTGEKFIEGMFNKNGKSK